MSGVLTGLSQRGGQVLNSVQAHKGLVTMVFSQGRPPVSAVLNMFPTTSGGICNALCNKWIAEHANDRSLWSWLAPKGTVDLGGLSSLMSQFMDKSIPWQNKRTAYLRMYGVIERGNVATGGGTGYDMGASDKANPNLGRDMAKVMGYGELKNSAGSYRAISLWGPKGIGHAVCAWMANDVCFFDPNFGEVYFENRADFIKWAPVFGQLSGYGKTYGGIWVRDFAKAV